MKKKKYLLLGLSVSILGVILIGGCGLQNTSKNQDEKTERKLSK